MTLMTLLLLAFLFHDTALASPTLHYRALQERDTNDTTVSIVVPVVVVVGFLLFVGILAYFKRGIRDAIVRLGRGAISGAALSSGTALPAGGGGTRELTAEQLAGSMRTSRDNAQPTNNRTRRTRRNRRTPSQISTTSLPAYMKEPGEQELVVTRGPVDLEDTPIPVDMPPLSENRQSEEDSEASLHSRNRSQTSNYEAMRQSPNTRPLLASDDNVQAQDTSRTRLLSSNPDVTGDSATPDPRGATPSYFEVVSLDQDHGPPSPARPSAVDETPPASASSAGTGSGTNTNRRSAFRNIFGALGNRQSSEQQQQGSHNRTMSRNSVTSGSDETSASPSRVRPSATAHRPSHSGSSSILSNFRPLHRKKSSPVMHPMSNLNSPSMMSVNSISSPLTHTAVRTQFTYPQSGPTPDQVKLISSRESFARFGQPYGADAVAFAASTSRQELVPPPDFEEVPRPSSSLSQTQRPATSHSRYNTSSSSNEDNPPAHTQEESHASTVVAPRVSDSAASVDPSADLATSGPSTSPTETSATSTIVQSSTAHPGPAKDIEESSEPTAAKASTADSSASKESDKSIQPVGPESSNASSTATAHSTQPTSAKTTAPSAFKAPAAEPSPFPSRSASRASSVATFTTAADTLNPGSASEYYSEQGSDASAPSTPRMSTRPLS